MAGLNIYSLVWNNLRRQPFRHGMLAACVAAAAVLQAAAGWLGGGAGSGIKLCRERLGADLIAIPDDDPGDPKGADLKGPAAWSYMDRKVEDKIAKFIFVAQTSAQVRIQSLAGDSCGGTGKISLIGFEPETDFTVRPWLTDRPGRRLGPDDALAGAALGLQPGSRIKLSGHPYQVADLLAPTGTELDFTVFVPLETASRMTREVSGRAQPILARRPDRISAVMIKLKPEGKGGVSPGEAAYELEKNLYEARIILPEPFLKKVMSNLGAISSVLRPASYAWWLITAMILGLAFAMATRERQREVGLLRALGAPRGFIFRMIILEALILAGAGAALGLTVSLGLGFGFSRLLAWRLAVNPYPPAGGERPGFFLLIFFLALLTTTAAAAYPAFRISRMAPDQAIRRGE